MAVTKSLALTSLFPKTVLDSKALLDVLNHLDGMGFGMVEFYTEPGMDEAIAALLKACGFKSILIAVLPLKAAGPSLCAVDEAERQAAQTTLRACIDRAAALGCQSVMVNSGFLPKEAGLLSAACHAYSRSIDDAFAYISSKGYPLGITLEPGDSCVQSFQLLGPTNRVLETTQPLSNRHPAYTLTMDVAHLIEEGEAVMHALRACLPWCSHVHLCNCVMDDPADSMYGDKHVDFDWPGASLTYADFQALFQELVALYGERDWTVTLEITCRAEDNIAWFDEVVRRCHFLWQTK